MQKFCKHVSIPYSSGHLFRWPLTACAFSRPRRASQSLIHQVIYSVYAAARRQRTGRKAGLNPLFIRSSIPLLESSSIHGGSSESQSLIHQVIYSVLGEMPREREMTRRRSQSLIHQVIYSVMRRIKKRFKITAESQSLIHQVIYSVGKISARFAAGRDFVSIPYSSGHLFRSSIRSITTFACRSLNPLFIRSSIPFCPLASHIRQPSPKSQSLIHQVIYSVGKER